QRKTFRDVMPIVQAVMAKDGILCNRAVEQDRVKANKNVAADGARAMHDRAVCNGSVFTNGYRSAVFGMNHLPVLNVGICPNNNGFHMAVFVNLVGADDEIGRASVV